MASKLRTDIRKQLIRGLKKDYTMNDKYRYYFTDYNDNLYEPMSCEHKKMFEGASGNELKDKVYPAKAKAIDSSSMLSYNFFRFIDDDHIVVINKIRYNRCLFEIKLPTLKTSNAAANIDVVLISEDEETILFIESKFLEYLDNDSTKLPKSYINESSFYCDNKENSALIDLCSQYVVKKSHYNYGIKQNTCHIVGISNIRNSSKAKGVFLNINKEHFDRKDLETITNKAKTYLLMDVIFVPCEMAAITLFDKYKQDLDNFHKTIPTDLKYINTPFVMTYGQLYDMLPDNLDVDFMKWLKDRYIQYHNMKATASNTR